MAMIPRAGPRPERFGRQNDGMTRYGSRMRFFIHSGEDVQEVVERYDSATLALEAVSRLARTLPNVHIRDEHGDPVSPADLQHLAAEENENDDA